MASSAVAASGHSHQMDRLDAARALLGVSPRTPSPSNGGLSTPNRVPSTSKQQQQQQQPAEVTNSHNNLGPITLKIDENRPLFTPSFTSSQFSNSVRPAAAAEADALSALAALASAEQVNIERRETSPLPAPPSLQIGTATPFTSLTFKSRPTSHPNALSSSSDDDSEAMPPPPPRARGRPRSCSNPEGMEKWDAFKNGSLRTSRRHFVLPASILEEELAEANAAMEAKEERTRNLLVVPKKRCWSFGGETDLDREQSQNLHNLPSSNGTGLLSSEKCEGQNGAGEDLTPEEMLRRARSRLLEDLSEGNLNGDKGVLTLPHSLAKYKEVYNKNGRIGIYTPAERAAIIARFNSKRSRRVWNKKIRYNCRKNLADRRMRVKGRFVKRSAEQLAKQAQQLQQLQPEDPNSVATANSSVSSNGVNIAATTETQGSLTQEPLTKANNTSETTAVVDEDMPDVNDQEAGFCPTEDQPYRRLRRHTIT